MTYIDSKINDYCHAMLADRDLVPTRVYLTSAETAELRKLGALFPFDESADHGVEQQHQRHRDHVGFMIWGGTDGVYRRVVLEVYSTSYFAVAHTHESWSGEDSPMHVRKPCTIPNTPLVNRSGQALRRGGC